MVSRTDALNLLKIIANIFSRKKGTLLIGKSIYKLIRFQLLINFKNTKRKPQILRILANLDKMTTKNVTADWLFKIKVCYILE